MSAHTDDISQPHRADAAERRTDATSTRLREAAVTTALCQCSAALPWRAGSLPANLRDASVEALSPRRRRGTAHPRYHHRPAARREPSARSSGSNRSK